MAVTDWKSPETVISETYWEISLPWSDTNNAKAEDGSLATNLPFDQGGVWVEQMLSHLVIGGSTSGNFYDTTGKKVTTGLPDISYDSLTWVTVGGSSSLWANSLSVSNVNNSGFGFALAYFDTYGYSADLLKCTNFGFSVPSGATITGIEAMVKHDKVLHNSFGMYPRVDCVKLRVYYTESSGTDANSERGLYIAGYDTSNSTKGLYLQGSLTSNSTRGLYIEGFVDTLYSRESSASLKADDSNLSTMFSEQDYTDVATDDDAYVDLEGIAQYFQLLFKEPNGNENNTDDFRVTWKGKSSLAPSSSAVYLQIYNRTTESWTTLVSNSSASANVEFTLEDTVSTDLSDYYDTNYIISVRVYQDGVV